MRASYRLFTWVTGLFLAVLLGVAFLGWLALWRGNNLHGERELAEALNTRGGIANTAGLSYFDFKKEIFAVRRAEITVVGSSRGLLFRQSMFNQPFSNLGGGPTNFGYGFSLIDKVFAERPPKLLLYAIDHFAFIQTGIPFEDRPVGGFQSDHAIRTNWLLLPYRLVLAGQLSPKDLVRLWIFGQTQTHTFPVYGIVAELLGGTGADGSSYPIAQMAHVSQQPAEERFRSELSCIERLSEDCRTGPFRPASHFDPRALAQLKRLLAEFRTRGVHVVPFLAPMPPMIMKALRASKAYGYLDELRGALKKELPEVHDMLDIEQLGATDCEFYDAIHAGEVADVRTLLYLSTRDPVFARYFKDDAARSIVARYAGSILAVSDEPSRGLARQIDAFHDADVCRSALTHSKADQ